MNQNILECNNPKKEKQDPDNNGRNYIRKNIYGKLLFFVHRLVARQALHFTT
jgi:hypothetical protein